MPRFHCPNRVVIDAITNVWYLYILKYLFSAEAYYLPFIRIMINLVCFKNLCTFVDSKTFMSSLQTNCIYQIIVNTMYLKKEISV